MYDLKHVNSFDDDRHHHHPSFPDGTADAHSVTRRDLALGPGQAVSLPTARTTDGPHGPTTDLLATRA